MKLSDDLQIRYEHLFIVSVENIEQALKLEQDLEQATKIIRTLVGNCSHIICGSHYEDAIAWLYRNEPSLDGQIFITEVDCDEGK
jgi:hypothetical protein